MDNKPLTIYEAFDLRMDMYYDEFCESYESYLDIFSERRDLYLQNICERSEMFDTFFESNTLNPISKMLQTIQKFVETMAEKVSSIFKKNDVDQSLSDLKKMKLSKDAQIESNYDYLSIIATDKKLRKRLEKALKMSGVDASNLNNAELKAIMEEYESMRKEKTLKKTKIFISVATLVGAILYFKNRSSDYKTYNAFVKSEMKKMNNGTHEITDPVKQKEYAEHIRNVAKTIKESESIKIPFITDLLTSLKRTIRMKKEEVVAIGKMTGRLTKKVVFDEDRKARKLERKERGKQAQEFHKSEVEKRLKVLQKWGKKEQN